MRKTIASIVLLIAVLATTVSPVFAAAPAQTKSVAKTHRTVISAVLDFVKVSAAVKAAAGGPCIQQWVDAGFAFVTIYAGKYVDFPLGAPKMTEVTVYSDISTKSAQQLADANMSRVGMNASNAEDLLAKFEHVGFTVKETNPLYTVLVRPSNWNAASDGCGPNPPPPAAPAGGAAETGTGAASSGPSPFMALNIFISLGLVMIFALFGRPIFKFVGALAR